MKIKIFPASYGDALLVSIENHYHLLIDGGLGETYKEHIKPYLLDLKDKGQILSKVIVTHLDSDHIAGIIAFLEQNGSSSEPNIIPIKEIWHNSCRHIRSGDKTPKPLSYIEQVRVEAYISANSTPTTSIEDVISARQSMELGRLILNGGYQWNTQFNKDAVSIAYNSKIKIGENIYLQLLSPSQEQLEALEKSFQEFLHPKGINCNSTDALIEYAFEIYMQNKKNGKLKKDKNMSASIKDNKITIDKIIEYSDKKNYEKDTKIGNASSIAFILYHFDKKVLFLADAHAEIIVEQLKKIFPKDEFNYPIIFNAIKVSHHGCHKNNSPCLLEVIDSPNFIFSTNGSKHEHPDIETIARIINRPNDKFKKDKIKRNLIFNYDLDILKTLSEESFKTYFNYEISITQELNL
jgi:beta-lactamase superfamily II metal-dependent hydrolase